MMVRIPRLPSLCVNNAKACVSYHRLQEAGRRGIGRPEEGRGRRGVAAVGAESGTGVSSRRSAQKIWIAAKKLPDDSAKEKKAKTKAVDKCKKDLEKAKGENEVAVERRLGQAHPGGSPATHRQVPETHRGGGKNARDQ